MTTTAAETGRRAERIEWGIRTVERDTRRARVEPRESESDAHRVLAARNESNLPYWRIYTEAKVVSRTVVSYTTRWSTDQAVSE